MKTKLLISGLAFMALTTLALAQNGNMPSSQSQKGTSTVNVDANKSKGTEANTTCPMGRMGQGMGKGMMGKGMRQGQRNGKGMGQGKGCGKNFVDADKIGVCDNFESATKK